MDDDQINYLKQLIAHPDYVVFFRGWGEDKCVELLGVIDNYKADHNDPAEIPEPVATYDNGKGHVIALWAIGIDELAVYRNAPDIAFPDEAREGTLLPPPSRALTFEEAL